MAFNWDIRRLYLYLVSFATLMMLIVGAIQTVQATLNFVYPEPTATVYPEKVPIDTTNLTPEEIKKRAEYERQRLETNQKYWQIRNLINSLAMMGVALPVYLYHWRKIQNLES